MTEKPPSYTVSFDIFEALNKGAGEALARLVAENKQLLAGGELWDSNAQNVALAEYLVTRNANQYLSRLERKGLKLSELVERANSSENGKEALGALYLLHNYLFFRGLQQRNLSFEDEATRRLALTLDRAPGLPAFPLLKLFLARLNCFFNHNNQFELFLALPQLRKLRDAARREAAEQARAPREMQFYVSVLAGARFYNLTLAEQNLYSPLELELVYRLFRLAGCLLGGDQALFDKQMAKTRAAAAQLQALQPLAVAEDKLLSETSPGRVGFEEKTLNRLKKHVAALCDYFAASKALHFGSEAEEALAALSSPALKKNGRFRARYALACTNLLARLCVAQGAPAHAASLLFNALSAKPRKKDGAALWEPGQAASALGLASTAYNLALAQAELGSLDAAAASLGALTTPFRHDACFWYRLGVTHAKLLAAELEALAERLEEAYAAAAADDQAKFPFSRVRRWSCNSQNVVEEFHRATERRDGRSPNLATALAAFGNVLRLAQDRLDPRQLAERARASEAAREETDAAAQREFDRWRRLNNSSVEHLAYLHLLAKEPVRALAAVARSVKPTPLERAKLCSYEAAAQLQLNNAQKAFDALSAQTGLPKERGRPLECFYPLGGTTSFSLGAQALLQYNRAAVAFQLRDRSTRAAVLEEYFAAGEEGRWHGKPNYHLHLAYCYHYRVSPSLQRLGGILQAVDTAGAAGGG